MALDELSGKLSIQAIRDHLKLKGFILSDQDALEEWELEQARRIVRDSRKYRNKTDEVQLEMVNLFEVLPDGTKQQYYKKFGEVSLDEGVQLLKYWNSRHQYDLKQFSRYFIPLTEKYGRKKVQRKLPFDLPGLAG